MKADIDAIRALIAPTGYTSYFVNVPAKPSYPYVLVWSSTGGLPVERPVADAHADVDEPIGVTTVATTPEGVLIAQAVVRGVLDLKAPVVTGRVTTLELTSSQPIRVDREVTLPVNNRNPAYGVDIYRYRSTPA